MDEESIEVFINPLAFFEVDQPWASLTDKEPTPQDIFRFLCMPGVPADVHSLTERYKEISQEKSRLFAAPNDKRILEKLVWPLRYAKASYIIGNFLSTIALCGMVAEMLTIFVFELALIEDIEIKDKKRDIVSAQVFEKMRQQDRVRTLRRNKVIDNEMKSHFDLVRKTRNKYLHLWSENHSTLPKDAVAVFDATVLIVVNAFGLGVQKGKLLIKPSIKSYLRKADRSRMDGED